MPATSLLSRIKHWFWPRKSVNFVVVDDDDDDLCYVGFRKNLQDTCSRLD